MTKPDRNARPRDGKQRFVRTVATAERDAEAARLRSTGMKYRDIAAELGVDVHNAHNAVQRALRAIVEEPAQDVRAMELERLDSELERLNALEATVTRVLERKHFTVSNGRIIYLGDEPLQDDGPVLQAVDRLLKIEEQRRRNGESRRKLLGLDEPVKAQITGGVTYEIVGVDLGKLR